VSQENNGTQSNSDLVRQQFGANAANYATSTVHAKGASLGRLIELIDFDADWRSLDIATAAGHVALACAEHVREAVGSDLTPEMLDVARQQAAERSVENVSFEIGDAEALPFDDNSFDLVTCRIAPHHFPNPGRFIAETARVLRPGGVFGLVDNVVPDDAEVAAFANDWERKRDPSHLRCLSVNEWLGLLAENDFAVTHSELMAKRMGFEMWCNNMSVPTPLRAELLTELAEASSAVTEFLRPELGSAGDQAVAAFHLTECVIVANQP